MSLTRIEKYSERGYILKNPPGRLLIVAYWTALGVWLAPGGRRFEPTKSPKCSFFLIFFFFTFFFLERFAVRYMYAHRRPPYCDVRTRRARSNAGLRSENFPREVGEKKT